MIISLRGTNGSGKSSIVTQLREQAAAWQVSYGLLGPSKPEAYRLNFPKLKRLLYVLGPYNTACGGCDAIQPYDLILELIPKYEKLGHVLFEGVLVSSSYGRVGRLMEEYGYERAVMAFLDTSLEQCIENVEKRRTQRGDYRPFNPHNLTTKYHSVVKSKSKMLAEKKVRVIDLPWKEGAQTVLNLLRASEK